MSGVVKSGLCLSLMIALTSCANTEFGNSVNGVLGSLGVSNALRTAKTPSDRQSVTSAQAMLNGLGYDAGTVDGVFGPKTDQAVKDYQRRKGMAANGQVTPELLAALKGDSGGDVADAQNADVRTAVIVGAVSGAIGGAMLGDKAGLSSGQGAVVGAAIGTGAGAVVGQKTASLRGDYSEKLSGIEAAIVAEDRQIAGLESEIAAIRSGMQTRQQEIDRVVERAGRGENVIQQKKQLLSQLEADLSGQREISKTIRARQKSVDRDIEEVRQSLATAGDNAAAFEHRLSQLTDQRDQLTASLNALNGIQPELEAQRNALIGQNGNQSTG